MLHKTEFAVCWQCQKVGYRYRSDDPMSKSQYKAECHNCGIIYEPFRKELAIEVKRRWERRKRERQRQERERQEWERHERSLKWQRCEWEVLERQKRELESQAEESWYGHGYDYDDES